MMIGSESTGIDATTLSPLLSPSPATLAVVVDVSVVVVPAAFVDVDVSDASTVIACDEPAAVLFVAVVSTKHNAASRACQIA
jgi:hypothetical protein